MMKGDCQLNQSLKMATACATMRGLAPQVFESLVGREETTGVEQVEPELARVLGHSFEAYTKVSAAIATYRFSYLSLTELSKKLY